jgi:transcription antitermination factor NusA-like protein
MSNAGLTSSIELTQSSITVVERSRQDTATSVLVEVLYEGIAVGIGTQEDSHRVVIIVEPNSACAVIGSLSEEDHARRASVINDGESAKTHLINRRRRHSG